MVFIIIRKHEPGFLIPELRSLEFVFRIPHLSAEGFHIQKAVIAFPAFDIMGYSIAVIILLLHICFGDFLRRDKGTGIGTG